MRILLVGKGPPDRGGIAAYLGTVLDSDLAQRHEVHLLNLAGRPPSTHRKLTLHNLRRAVSDAWAVWRAAGGFDVVHIHSALARHLVVGRAGLLALAGRARRCRVIVHAHSGRASGWFTTPGHRLSGKVLLAPADRVVAVAEGGLEVLREVVGAERVVLITNGVDSSAYGPRPRPHDPPRILYAGVLITRKGVLDLLEASASLERRGLAHELVLAGGTPDEGTEAERVVREAAPERVRVLGPQPHERMAEVYREADIFCLPSWGEAMPMSVLEAMASGLPVVATSVGDIPRMVVDGVTGRVVPPQAPDLLADALAPLLIDPALRQRMGEAGRERVMTRSGLDGTVTRLEALYRELETA